MSSELPQLQWIDSAPAFEKAIREISAQTVFGIDTEADSFFSYREKACLIQISTEEDDYLIDPLAGLDLSALGELFANPKVLKIFHDGEYDIGLLKNDFGFSFVNLFDTRVAVMALGSKKPGLASVLQERFGIELDKKFQRSDWGQRPLLPEQLEYARLDTRYLIALYKQLEPELRERGRMHIAEGEFHRLERLEAKRQEFDPQGYLRIKGARMLDPVSLQVLRSLYMLREELAKKAGLPHFRIFANESLFDVALRLPENEKELSKARGFTWKQVRRLGKEVLQAIREAIAKGPLEKHSHPKPRDPAHNMDREEEQLYERLRKWRMKKAEEEGLDPSHVIKRQVLVELAKKPPKSVEGIAKVAGVEPWQIESYGHEILKVLHG